VEASMICLFFFFANSPIKELSQTPQKKKRSSTIPYTMTRNRRPGKKKNLSGTLAFFFYQREFGVGLKEQPHSFSQKIFAFVLPESFVV
jgi:hypothetical protein